MNRHFRVPPEHRVFWEGVKQIGKVYFLVFLFWAAFIAALIYFMSLPVGGIN